MKAKKRFIVIVLLLILPACAPLKPLNRSGPKDLTMSPIADLRADQTIEIDLDKVALCIKPGWHNLSSIWIPHQRCLEEKGYNPVILENYGSKNNISIDDVEYLDPTWMASIGPHEADLVLLISVDDIVKRKVFGFSYSLECSGILYSKKLKDVVWKKTENFDWEMGGPLGAIGSLATDADEVTGHCVHQLIENMPNRE